MSWIDRFLRLEMTHPKVEAMARAAEDLARRFAHQNTNRCVLVLSGDSGTGKTHVAKSLYDWSWRASGVGVVSSVFQRWPEACEALLDGSGGLVLDCMEADFLVLDDIGAESDRFKTGVPIDKLCQILSRRERRFTVITTNIPPGEWSRMLGVRVADRLLRNSVVVDLSGVPSYSIRRLAAQ